MSDIKEDFEGNLLNAEMPDAIVIEGTDGNEYRIEKKLPVKAANIFNQYMSVWGLKDPEGVEEIIKKSDAAIEYTIATMLAANKNKYPNLTKDNIIGDDEKPGIFTEYEIGVIFNIYFARWLEIANRKLRSETKPPAGDKKKETEAKDV